jgi:hypothetical protein
MSTSHNAFLPPDLRALIEADRNQPGPPEEVRQDVARRVDRALGLGGAMLIPVPSALGKASVAPQAGTVAAPVAVGVAAWKIAVGVAVVALAGGGGFTIAARRAPVSAMHEPAAMAIGRSAGGVSAGPATIGVAPEAKSAAAPSNVDTSAPSISLDLDSEPASDNVAAPGAAAKGLSPERAHPARPADRLADERKLLDRARTALAHRDPADALAAIRAHEKAFGRGQLVEEREGMRVQALVVAHDFGSARAAGERFRKAYPHSVFLPVVDRALEIAR